jgi:mannose-6-phosphate isomerase-like protein (cupin superfamily)
LSCRALVKSGVDDETRRVGAGDATRIPTGSLHRLFNKGDENLVILVVASPNW